MFAMGLGTFLIGCLPTYSQIGVWAPIFLVILRFVQGIGLGGEWSGAVVMVAEHAGNRRGFTAVWCRSASPSASPRPPAFSV